MRGTDRARANIDTIRALAVGPPDEAVARLAPFLRDRSAAVRQQAAAALAGIDHPAVLELLLAAYEWIEAAPVARDPGCRIRQIIVEAAGQAGDVRALSVVRRAAHTVQVEVGFGPEDTAVGLRATAALALAKLDPGGAAYDLGLLLFDEEPNVPTPAAERPFAKAPVRRAAARALGSLASETAEVLLAIKVRRPHGEVEEVLADCIDALAARGSPRLSELVQPYLDGENPFLIAAAATALAAACGAEALSLLAERVDRVLPQARVPLILAISSIRSEQTGRALLPFTEHPDAAVRQAAVEGVAAYADPAVRERLADLAERDPDPRVREAAARGLAQ
ncbi:MAG TPA: HEAT repeat domain-containing protein [Limnochordia bacterium]